ncbi:MAG: Maf family nucleotide pyrophosphatase [Bacteroidia bacterium]
MILNTKFSQQKIYLGSKSPRRKDLLAQLGLEVEILHMDVDEDFPEKLQRESIPLYLASEKSKVGLEKIKENEILITADTIVWLNNRVLNKPSDDLEAAQMLNYLSGKTHEVITAVCIASKAKVRSIYSVTEVQFKSLREEEIEYYIKNYKPFDKAGAYGIQEWIGYVGVESIQGSYTNVVGLPLKELYEELLAF